MNSGCYIQTDPLQYKAPRVQGSTCCVNTQDVLFLSVQEVRSHPPRHQMYTITRHVCHEMNLSKYIEYRCPNTPARAAGVVGPTADPAAGASPARAARAAGGSTSRRRPSRTCTHSGRLNIARLTVLNTCATPPHPQISHANPSEGESPVFGLNCKTQFAVIFPLRSMRSHVCSSELHGF
jgi:hypothetical protein